MDKLRELVNRYLIVKVYLSIIRNYIFLKTY